MTPTVPTVAFVLEQHLGHRTFAENLRRSLGNSDRARCAWIPVTYGPARVRDTRVETLRSTWVARREVIDGVRAADADVHVFNTQVPAVIGGRTARSKPYVLITDVTPRQYDAMAAGYGHRADRDGLASRWKHHLNVRSFQGAARCIGWSTWAAESIRTDYGVEPSRIAVVPPGVDTTVWAPGSGTRSGLPRVLFVGGEFERKGGDLLLRAVADLSHRCEVVVVTKSPVPSTPGLTVVDDLGPNDPRLIELYRTSCMFVLPSRAETFGIAAVEAASVGLPVVASRVGGLAELVVDGETGLTVDVDDVGGLRAAIARLLDDPSLRTAFGAAARDRAVEHFDADRNASRVLELALESIRSRSDR